MNSVHKVGKNSLLLYFRFITLILSTVVVTKCLVEKLGLIEFGVLTVSTSIIVLVGFLQSSLSLAAQRYFSHSLGKCNENEIPKVYTCLFIIDILVVLIVTFLVLIFDEYLVNELLNIPNELKDPAVFAFKTSIIVFSCGLFSSKFIALFISYESVGLHVKISILDSVLKILCALMFDLLPIGGIYAYTSILAFESLIILFIYVYYAKKEIKSIKLTYKLSFKEFYEVYSFVGWNLFGSLAYVFKIQGVNIILNIYFGPLVNSARTIAMQISVALNAAIQSLQTALSPSVVKFYASNQIEKFHKNIILGAKYNFIILIILSTPVFILGEHLVNLWLGQVPEYSIIFLRLAITVSLVDSLCSTLITAVQATGKIKKYQIIVGSTVLLELPFSVSVLGFGAGAIMVGVVSVIMAICALFVRLIIVPKLVDMNVKVFICDVIMKVFPIYIVSMLSSFLIINLFDEKMFVSIWLCLVLTSVQLLLVWLFCFDVKERYHILNYSKIIYRKIM